VNTAADHASSGRKLTEDVTLVEAISGDDWRRVGQQEAMQAPVGGAQRRTGQPQIVAGLGHDEAVAAAPQRRVGNLKAERWETTSKSRPTSRGRAVSGIRGRPIRTGGVRVWSGSGLRWRARLG
jgi:hypothetical protein